MVRPEGQSYEVIYGEMGRRWWMRKLSRMLETEQGEREGKDSRG